MEALEAIKVLAFRTVQQPDTAYLTRRLHRWYSKTFHVPLEKAEELPLEDVWQVFFEEKYEDMSPDELEAEKQEILLSDEDRSRRAIEAEALEAEMFEFGKAAKVAAAKSAATKKQLPSPKPLAPIRATLPEANLPNLPAISDAPPIKMETISDAELAAELAAMEEFGIKK